MVVGQNYNHIKKKKAKEPKKKTNNSKKFPELKMHVNGDYRGSNYTMSSDDEIFNVSFYSNIQFPPIKKSMAHQAGVKEVNSVYSN